MASNPPIVEDPCNTETEEETIAFRKKRSRRVSFADIEITSVHIFNRDEDYETPPRSSEKNSGSGNASEAENEVLGFFRDLADSDDSKEMSPTGDDDDDDDIVNARKSFLRPIESPSPGSTIVGSATSNDDNFFGPVSASFIRPGRLSDSAASDDNHDITMDSTAFSMHFHSLARSDSGGNTLVEKTPSHVSTPSDSGSFMVLTRAKKLIPQVSLPFEKVSGGRDSNEMSLVGEKPYNYDYGELSPTLEALLAEGSKNPQDSSVSDSNNKKSLKRSDLSTFDENPRGRIDEKDYMDKETSNIGKLDIYTEGESAACMELDEVNGVSLTTLVDQNISGGSCHRNEDLAADVAVDQQIQTPNHLSKQFLFQLQVNDEHSKPPIGMNMLNVELPAASGGCTLSVDSKVRQWNVFSHDESRKDPIEGCLEETSNNKRDNYAVYQNSDQQHRSPAVGSISSLSAKQQKIFLDAAKSCRQLSYATPSPRQPGSFFGKENISSRENILPGYSSYKFKIFEPSPLAYSLKDGIEKSKLRLSKLLSSTTSPLNAVGEENCKGIKGINADALVTNLEKHLFSVDQKNRDLERTDYRDSAGVWNPKNDGSLSEKEGTICLGEDAETLIPASSHILSKEGDTQLMSEMASPSQFTSSQNNVSEHISMPENSKKQTVGFGSDSPSVKIELDHGIDVKTSRQPGKFVPSAKMLDQRLSSSTENHGTVTQDPQNFELVCVGLGQDKTSICNVTSNNYSAAATDESESRFSEGTKQSTSSLTEINHFGDIDQVEKVHDKQSYPPNLQNASETLPNIGTPFKERNALKFLSRSPDRNIPFATDPIHSEGELPGEWNEASLSASDSLYIHRRNVNESSFMKSPFKKVMTQSPVKKEQSQRPSKKELCNLLNDDNVQSLARKNILSPNFNTSVPGDSDSHLELHVSHSQIPEQDIENSSLRKRRIEELVPEDGYHEDTIRSIKRSPNIHKSQGSNFELMLACASGSDDKGKMTRSDTTMKLWSDILLKFLTDTRQLFSPFIDKLNIISIGVLQDILVHQEKIKVYEILCTQIQPQKMYDQSSEVRHKRVAETKMLLYKLAYERARQQLKSVKHKKLLKRAQEMSSAIHRSEMLKSKQKFLFVPSGSDTMVDSLRNSCTSNLGSKHEVSWEKVATLKHECEALDRKIKNLMKSFQNYFKMKGEPSCSETIVLLNDHLKKKTSCRLIHDDLKLWEVDDFGSRNGKENIVLNYQGLISKRFVINDGPIPSIFVSNALNDIIIAKNFPNMDARVAFACVLNAKNTKKHVGSKSFAQETQITCSLLHNLLDVVGEVQLAQLEIRNVVQTCFCSSSVEQLDLQLCFIDFNNGRKVMVTLDMTCLKCGIYPSDILPYQLQAYVCGTYTSLPESLLTKIKAAVDGLRVGYSRIIRLCRCISEVVQSSST
ncbi:uncharacterized protein LOC110648837 isoform X2 [Hevea brasiliensis]|uniref:uncharacterized protein LOC110648837 isoform X2 n=1 Tax=Hevea brasiliensis TaxID=3981 RepID=UPI0025E964E6|nr:uncharacterized protein LOC110648837 isoform X2 [Hevea brasiliensis]